MNVHRSEDPLLRAALEVLEGTPDWIEAVRVIADANRLLRLHLSDSTYDVVYKAAGESYRFPTGAVREHRTAEELSRLDLERDAFLYGIRNALREACREIVAAIDGAKSAEGGAQPTRVIRRHLSEYDDLHDRWATLRGKPLRSRHDPASVTEEVVQPRRQSGVRTPRSGPAEVDEGGGSSGVTWFWLVGLLVIVAVVWVLAALPDPDDSAGDTPVADGRPAVPVFPTQTACADSRDFIVVAKRFSTQYTSSSVAWCASGFLVQVQVLDDSRCFEEARVGRRKPDSCG